MRFYNICIYFVLSMLHGYFWNWRCSKVRIPLLKTFHPIVSYICRNCSKKLLRMCFTYSTRFFFYLSSSDVQFRGFQFDLTLLDPQHFPKLPPFFKFDLQILMHITYRISWYLQFSKLKIILNTQPSIWNPLNSSCLVFTPRYVVVQFDTPHTLLFSHKMSVLTFKAVILEGWWTFTYLVFDLKMSKWNR